MIYLHSDSRCLAPSQNTKTRLITRALSLSPFETTLSLSHSLSGCVLSLFTLGRSLPSFFFNFHLIFRFLALWFFTSVSHTQPPPPSSLLLSLQILLSTFLDFSHSVFFIPLWIFLDCVDYYSWLFLIFVVHVLEILEAAIYLFIYLN